MDLGRRMFYIFFFGDVAGLETSRQQAMTMNFLPNMDNSSESSRLNLVAPTSNVKSSDFFPEIGSFGASSSKEDNTNKTDFRCVFCFH